MKHVGLADAKARLSELVTDAENGETIEITRRGRVVARIVPAEAPAKKPLDLERLRRFQASMPYQDERAADFIRTMRDDERY